MKTFYDVMPKLFKLAEVAIMRIIGSVEKEVWNNVSKRYVLRKNSSLISRLVSRLDGHVSLAAQKIFTLQKFP